MFPEDDEGDPLNNAVLAMRQAARIENFGGIRVVRALNQKLSHVQYRCTARTMDWERVARLIVGLSGGGGQAYLIHTSGNPTKRAVAKWGASVKTSVFVGVRLPDGNVVADIGRGYSEDGKHWLSIWPELKPWPTQRSSDGEGPPVTHDAIYQHLLPWAKCRREKLLLEFPQGSFDEGGLF